MGVEVVVVVVDVLPVRVVVVVDAGVVVEEEVVLVVVVVIVVLVVVVVVVVVARVVVVVDVVVVACIVSEPPFRVRMALLRLLWVITAANSRLLEPLAVVLNVMDPRVLPEFTVSFRHAESIPAEPDLFVVNELFWGQADK